MRSFTLLNAAVADVTGTQAILDAPAAVFFIKSVASGGTPAGTIALQSKSPAGDWHTFHTVVITTAAEHPPVVLDAPLEEVRAVLSARTAGAFTVSGMYHNRD